MKTTLLLSGKNNAWKSLHPSVALVLIFLLLASASSAPAALKTWLGTGGTGNWSTSLNWSPSGAPANGDDLSFPAGAGQLLNTNNLVRSFSSIAFSGGSGGYIIRGNAITLTNGLTAAHTAGLNTVDITITNGASQTITATTGGTLAVNGDIVFNGFNLTVNNTVAVSLGGLLSGTGNLVKNGSGNLLLNGGIANTYVGLTTVNNGTLELNDNGAPLNAMIPGDLTINSAGSVLLTEGNQIADTAAVTVNGGLFNLNGLSETIATLTMTAGTVSSGVGTLTCGNITTLASATQATINGALTFTGERTLNIGAGAAACDLIINAVVGGAGGIIKTGAGTLCLDGANTYTGATTINAGLVSLDTNTGLGTSAGGVTVNSNAVLLLNNAHVTNEVLTLNSINPSGALQVNATGDWIGPITLSTNVVIEASSLLQLGGVISGPGGFTKIGASTLRFSGGAGGNTYTGPTTVNTGILELGKSGAINSSSLLTIGDGVGGSNVDIVRYIANNGINSSVPIHINASGRLDLNGFSDTVGALTLIGGAITTGTGTLTMANNLTAASTPALNVASISGNLALGAATRTFMVTNGLQFPDLNIYAAISGTGGIIKAGDGGMSLVNSNSYSGATTVNDGVLLVYDDFALGTTAGGVTVNGDAQLLMIDGAHVGAEALTLNSANGFNQPLSSFSGSNSWAGTVTLSADVSVNVSTNFLNLSGVIVGNGGLRKTGNGTLIYSGAGTNTYAGVTTVSAGTLVLAKSIPDASMTNNLVIGDGAGGVNADVVRTEVTAQLANTTVAVTVNSSGLLEITHDEAIGSLAGSGNVVMNTGPIDGLTPGLNNSSTVFSGVISGPGEFTKSGTGTMTLSGDNTYTGRTAVNSGKLIVNGLQQQSHVNIGVTGTLAGSGTVGNITNTLGGSVAPGTSPGTLTSSNVVFSGASSDFNVELTGLLPGVNYDQLNVRGSNSLGGATLNVTANFGSSNAPIPGATFTILNNDAAEAITGTFAGLADNAVFTASGMRFRIDYDGGTGNDVVLTFTNAALAQTAGASISTGNGNGTVDPNECNYLNIVITNTAADATTNIVATLYSDTPGVSVTQPFSSYPNIPIGGKRTNSTPFQISTAPTFVCGTNIQLRLVVQTGNHGTFAVPVVINSGSAGVPVSFVNNIATPIPDLGTVNRLFSVSGIVAPVGRVEVSFQISHTSDADLDIFLVGPDGTRVELTTDNGGTFDDYGTDCSVSGRTRFSDLAATTITAGSAPFVGTFRPEGSLSAFIGKSGSAVNGTWTLEITDDAAGALGTINCATVFVYPATCAVGSGACELCPEVTINGFVGIGSPAMATNRMTRNGLASASICGIVDVCPGPFAEPGNNYEVHTFYNGPSNACINVTLGSALANVFSSAYLGSFNPTNVCLNYLADAGFSTTTSIPTPYSFDVPANAVFAIVVNTINGLGGSYTLQVSGGDCRPELNITALPGNKALLDWTTAATGYNLESTNALISGGSSIWPVVTNIPVVINSRFAVTNNVTSSNQFYHLRKP